MPDPLKPKLKNLTVNQLPAELVDNVKYTAINMDCYVHEIMEIALRLVLEDKDKLFADIYRLRQQKKREKKQMQEAKAQLRKIVEDVEL